MPPSSRSIIALAMASYAEAACVTPDALNYFKMFTDLSASEGAGK